MLTNIFSLSVFFRVINFGAFLTFLGFLFKQYLLPGIQKQIKEKKLLLQNLEQQKQGIKYQQSNLENAMEHQQHVARELTKKIMLWNATIERHNKDQLQQEKILIEKIQKKIALQVKEQDFKRLNNKVIPIVISQAEHTLSEKFESNAMGKNFVQDIITFIQESNS